MGSGYCPCACRDCFEVAIGNGDGPALCWECEESGCDDSGESECCAECGYDSTDYEAAPLEGEQIAEDDT